MGDWVGAYYQCHLSSEVPKANLYIIEYLHTTQFTKDSLTPF
jgi:hypothetical protein